jgi:hypothetical protein
MSGFSLILCSRQTEQQHIHHINMPLKTHRKEEKKDEDEDI